MPNCPQCGAELDSGDPAGLCPQCLILGAFESTAGVDESRTQTIQSAAGALDEDDFGRYRIIRPLGEGGMGAVYLAEQREPIRRRVALKVVKLGMDTGQVLARFANERQALAMMDHPNIARILDAGATARGRPYFVMEYIEGVPLTQYCDRQRMTIPQRLELFLEVCRAIQHAHQKGVIHRDLKPSNVLVTEQEGRAVPKVIDFGIAKATDRWVVENTLLTQFGQMVGTPEYASPEQADIMAGEISPVTDVYSLGVLLYELLIGAVPFDGELLRKSGYGEMLRILREEEPPSLSRRFTTLGAVANDIAARRQTDPASLRRLMDGDLNRIAMKALEKIQKRRYASAAELEADIQRYIDHRPVLASPPTLLYRTRKFVRRHRPAVLGAVAGLAVIALGAVTVWSIGRGGSAPAANPVSKATIVLADFANTTGDPSLGNPLRQVMLEELGKSAYLNVLPDTRIGKALRLMVRAPDTKLTPNVAGEVCERTGSAAAIEGSLARLGTEYALSLRARECRTGDVLDSEQASAAKKDDVFKVLSEMTGRFQARAGQTIARLPKPVALPFEVTTPSLEAWRSFQAAWTGAVRGGKNSESAVLTKRAVEIDPQFAMAYSLLGRNYDSIGEGELGAQNITKAYQLRDHVSDQENYFITFNYYRQVPRNLELARQTLESWTQRYPDDFMPHGFFIGFTTPGLGQFEKGLEEGQKTLELEPNDAINYYNTAFDYLYLNRVSEAEALIRSASERKIDTAPEFSLLRYFLGFLHGNQMEMEKEAAQRRGRQQAQGWFEHQEAQTLAYHGQLKEASGLSDSAVALARQANLRERAALFEGARAAWNALFGVREDARKSAAAALSLYQGRDASYGPAFAMALLHDSAKSESITAELAKRYPEDTSVQFSYLPSLRGLDALNRGNAAKAVEMTQAATPYEFAVTGGAYFTDGAFFGSLYPIYVRGLAYSRLGRHDQAAAEFQKILDHSGITLNDPIGPMARLQLARALSASGNRAKSAAAYRDLMNIWQDADPDLPVVQEAKAESARQQ